MDLECVCIIGSIISLNTEKEFHSYFYRANQVCMPHQVDEDLNKKGIVEYVRIASWTTNTDCCCD